jgi:hypothetical protein
MANGKGDSEVYLQSCERPLSNTRILYLSEALMYKYQLGIRVSSTQSHFPSQPSESSKTLIASSVPNPNLTHNPTKTIPHHHTSNHRSTKMYISTIAILTLLVIALFLSPASTLPVDLATADDCHQGLYCGSWGGQAALVSFLFLSIT